MREETAAYTDTRIVPLVLHAVLLCSILYTVSVVTHFISFLCEAFLTSHMDTNELPPFFHFVLFSLCNTFLCVLVMCVLVMFSPASMAYSEKNYLVSSGVSFHFGKLNTSVSTVVRRSSRRTGQQLQCLVAFSDFIDTLKCMNTKRTQSVL